MLGGEDAVELVSDQPAEARSSLVTDNRTKVDHGSGDLTKVDRGAGASVADETARLDRLEADLLELKGEIARLREALGD
ncbi:MAG TPA: hypothetical protein VHE08_02130 [Solirubrobacterales bacterium]|nr:hypothetical protein [Solirubrobacterales bacterium]